MPGSQAGWHVTRAVFALWLARQLMQPPMVSIPEKNTFELSSPGHLPCRFFRHVRNAGHHSLRILHSQEWNHVWHIEKKYGESEIVNYRAAELSAGGAEETAIPCAARSSRAGARIAGHLR